jgi:hypothetical protein
MMALPRLSETAATIVCKDAVATIKLDRYSVNLCFYRAADEGDVFGDVYYNVQFRTSRGRTGALSRYAVRVA